MMHFTAPYTYKLPPELIAHTAAEPRDSARLLHRAPNGSMTDYVFRELPQLLRSGDLLVLNTSKVIPARLHMQRPKRDGTGAVTVEILLHRPLDTSLTRWSAFARPARRLKQGDTLTLAGATATVAAHHGNHVEIRFNIKPEDIEKFLEENGETPLPPYIQTEDSPQVRSRYQTVYAAADQPGSVAAPTAGLHFTPEMLAKLNITGVTLHVGAGTFQNPTEEQLASRQLHAEWVHISPQSAKKIIATRRAGGRIIPVGTTALRALESWARHTGLSPNGYAGETTLFLQPGDDFLVTDALITNFHLPESSLLMLVAAFIGLEEMHRVYNHALALKYRFYSFGDASFLEPPKKRGARYRIARLIKSVYRHEQNLPL